MFHRDCVTQWETISRDRAQIGLKCPMCRTILKEPYFANVWLEPFIDAMTEAGKQKADNERLCSELKQKAELVSFWHRQTEDAMREAEIDIDAHINQTIFWKVEAEKALAQVETWKRKNMETEALLKVSEGQLEYWRKYAHYIEKCARSRGRRRYHKTKKIAPAYKSRGPRRYKVSTTRQGTRRCLLSDNKQYKTVDKDSISLLTAERCAKTHEPTGSSIMDPIDLT